VEVQIKVYDQKIAAARMRRYAFYAFLAVMAIGGLVILYRMGIFVLSSKDLKSRT
jgi:hypothetical protein